MSGVSWAGCRLSDQGRKPAFVTACQRFSVRTSNCPDIATDTAGFGMNQSSKYRPADAAIAVIVAQALRFKGIKNMQTRTLTNLNEACFTPHKR